MRTLILCISRPAPRVEFFPPWSTMRPAQERGCTRYLWCPSGPSRRAIQSHCNRPSSNPIGPWLGAAPATPRLTKTTSRNFSSSSSAVFVHLRTGTCGDGVTRLRNGRPATRLLITPTGPRDKTRLPMQPGCVWRCARAWASYPGPIRGGGGCTARCPLHNSDSCLVPGLP